MAAAEVAVTVRDDDALGVTVSPRRLSVAEDGGTATYAVVLGSQPTGAVTVTPSIGDASVAAASGALTFTPSNWSAPQTVTVTGVNDDIDNDPDRSATVSHAVSGADYDGMAAAEVAVTVRDDDALGVTVSPRRLSVAEDGGTATYAVVLGSQPTGAVTVTPSIGDASVAAASGALTFTPSNWSAPQTVTVTGVNDDIDNDPDRSATVSHAVSGADYDGMAAAEVAVTVRDDDARGVTLGPRRLSAAENGGTATYTVVLGSQPTGAVTVTPSIGDASVAAASGALTFTPSNWSSPQTVTVTGVNDDIDNAPDRETRISHAVSGGDYGGVPAADVTVTAVDDDSRAVIVSAESVSVDETGRRCDLRGGSGFAADRRGDGDAFDWRRLGGGGLGRADVHGLGLVGAAIRDRDRRGRRHRQRPGPGDADFACGFGWRLWRCARGGRCGHGG